MNAISKIQSTVSDENAALDILIVGAGIGGLTAAIALRQQGHNVKIFEQSRFANETGAAIHLAPNCNGLLRKLGLKGEDIGANSTRVITELSPNGEKRHSMRVDGPMAAMWQDPWQLVHRINLHQELKRLATERGGKGHPAELHTSSRIETVNCEEASIQLHTGEVIHGDAVIGADGVNSATRKFVVGDSLKPVGSGKSAFRWMISRAALQKDEKTAKYVEQSGEMMLWIGDDRRLVMYPCSNNTVMNFVGIHPSSESDSSTKEWNQSASKDRLLKVYDSFGEGEKALLSHADPESLKLWTLLDMETLPVWTRGKSALLGDAAHPFLPHQGQGGGQAIEDAASLAVVLPKGTPRTEIPERLKLYEKCRHERATTIQHYTRLAGRDASEIAAAGEKLDMQQFVGYNFGHSEWDYSTQMLRKWEQARNPKLYWRMPVGFGPAPGPRQNTFGMPRNGENSTFKNWSIRFRTSRTLLQNLLPNDSFCFASPATVAEASFITTTLDKMEWLGGKGYSHSGLYVHGVQYKKRDGAVLNGTFLAVLFESLTDPITTGREELGMPKLFCEIDTCDKPFSSEVRLSWRGAEFGRLTWSNLKAAEPAITPHHDAPSGTSPPGQLPPDEGILAYRYVPAVGERGKADAEYAVFDPHVNKSVERKVLSTRLTEDAEISMSAGDWSSLPTLHHVSSRFSELPVLGIVEAKVEHGKGVDDVSGAHRIE